ncbi:MAG: hypothetical protein AAFX93_11025 [Verrucomicrobiota bacterium]
MELTDDQKKQVASWVQAGEGLAEVQRRIESEFNAQLTYMEVRFLVDDLELDLVDEEAAAPEQPASTAPAEPSAPVDAGPPVDANASLLEEGPIGGVSVELDAVMRPGSMVSGSVTFSDGKSMGWQVDQMGRLGLIPGSDTEEGYRPSEADLMDFQNALETELRNKGM